MRYRDILISFLLLCIAAPAFAQESRYRVEILVLRHLEQNELPQEQLELPDYSMAVDFLSPPAEEESPDAANSGDEGLEAGKTTPENLIEEDALAENSDEVEIPEDPNRLIHIEEMSTIMQEAWRRLRLSGPFRPEQYLSWEQGSQEPFPALRVHDLQAVMIDDPWAGFRTEPEDPVTVFTDPAGQDAAEGSEQIAGPALPDPVIFYRLDGTVMLRRSRFLHLDLEVQLREPLWEQDLKVAPVTDELIDQPVQPSSFRVHELKQSRQVRSGRMEYFDGPVLAVLAWITEVKEESEETP